MPQGLDDIRGATGALTAEQLRAARLGRKLTLAGMADLLQLPRPTLKAYEPGARPIPVDFCLRLSLAFRHPHGVAEEIGRQARRFDWPADLLGRLAQELLSLTPEG